MSTTIESLELEIQANSKNAVNGIDALTQSLAKLKNATKGGLGLSAVSDSIRNINNAKLDKGKIESFVKALEPLSKLSKSNLSSFIAPLQKLPKVFADLEKIDMDKFASKIQEVATAMKPLANEMEKISNGFSAMPTKIQKLITQTNKLPSANKKAKSSFTDLYHEMKSVINIAEKVTEKVWQAVKKSMSYTENLNLFAVSMGTADATTDAMAYAESVSDAMGIDTSEWIRAQGIFQTMATGFGVAGDRAAVMSKNLTQLGYDLSSLYNIETETALLKLKSGLAGELEPLRELGYDLSQAKLEATALKLGITKSVDAMTQAEKAQLRYYAIMTQVTTAHGDMANTLTDPANQMRVLKSEFNKTAREIGNAFIPALQKAFPLLIAFTKVVGELATLIASLSGYKAEDPTERLRENTSSTEQNLEGAQKEAKKLKSYMLGIDELNVLSADTDSASESLSGWLDFDLPTYEFLPEGMTNEINEIVAKMKEWLGLTDEIDSWAELFDTRLGKILKTVGAIALAFVAWKVVMGIVTVITTIATAFSKISSLFGKSSPGGGSSADSPIDIETASSTVSDTTSKLKGLIKNLALGIAVIAEIIAAVVLVVAAIWLLGIMLKEVGIAWQPVIDNGETIATAMGIGIGLLVGIGVVTAVLGYVGASLVVALALGIAMLALIGAAAVLFLGEIILIGLILPKVGEAWQPVLDNGESIKNGILIGTGILLGIGLVAALLGVATVASYGLLPIAIGLGTAMLVQLGTAVVAFTDSLIKVANKLSEDLHPALDGANKVLPDLQTNMQNFTTFMSAFAWEIVKYSADTAISGIAATISSIIGFFTTDPITKMTKEVESQNGQFDKLIRQLEKAIPKIQRAIDLTNDYNTAMSNYGNVAGGNGSSGWFSNVVSGIGSVFSRSVTDSVVSVSIPAYASGGFPNQGQMFIAREAGAEMVGSIGRKTAVANNDQIVSGIAGGVAEANEEQNALLREQNTLLRAILDKDSGVILDGRHLANSVEKYQRERGRVLVTGGVI